MSYMFVARESQHDTSGGKVKGFANDNLESTHLTVALPSPINNEYRSSCLLISQGMGSYVGVFFSRKC
jgi:hypothetical protein